MRVFLPVDSRYDIFFPACPRWDSLDLGDTDRTTCFRFNRSLNTGLHYWLVHVWRRSVCVRSNRNVPPQGPVGSDFRVSFWWMVALNAASSSWHGWITCRRGKKTTFHYRRFPVLNLTTAQVFLLVFFLSCVCFMFLRAAGLKCSTWSVSRCYGSSLMRLPVALLALGYQSQQRSSISSQQTNISAPSVFTIRGLIPSPFRCFVFTDTHFELIFYELQE